MRAIGYLEPQPISAPSSLVDIELPRPKALGRDILVEVKAVSVNPVDTKVRAGAKPADGQHRVLGWDAAGIVVETGPDVSLFKPGDAVYYAGAINRPGSNAEFHLVDERIAALKPRSLDFAAAAALPLTTITAYEALFDRLEVTRPVAGAANAIVIVGAAGGVGSIAIQLLRALTDLTVIATASRPETVEWVKARGAHHVIDHRKSMSDQVAALGIGTPAFVFSLTHSGAHADEISKLIAPQGRVALIDDPKSFDVTLFKSKALSLHWEMMFARPVHQTADMIRQHELLTEVAGLVDAGKVKSTMADTYGTISATNLKRAHAQIESGTTLGKIVLAGW
ncbi:zinc-binding alcohol dehydrogenase family protein [Mesorhizobium sp. 1M-11]|uniref:zinc-binding alcohol dehydrogenase family protein n=1 Tax=Mesorhizobium sp. 1M-11 TaxID=1529006 RepID=UPI0006C739BE|nr:zinc-binding alcohol dehydrogenase family protein [Mesorhizobium sp. 1M-11]